MNKIIKSVLFLAIVAGLSGAALSFVYEMTDPVIQEAAIASVKDSLSKIYTSGEEFKAVETSLSDYPSLQNVYEAVSGGSTKGYIYKCSVSGYGGVNTPIVFLIALDQDGTYKGYDVIDCSGETKGFGSQVAEETFKNGIVGKNIGDSIDTISGATISSSAVVGGIEEATQHYNANFK